MERKIHLFLFTLILSLNGCLDDEMKREQELALQKLLQSGTNFDWNAKQPDHIPKLNILVVSRRKYEKQITRLYGDIPEDQWPLAPYALRALCKEIPDLPDAFVWIYRHKNDEFDDQYIGYLGEPSYQLVFGDGKGENPYPLRLNLGKNWCNR